MSVLDRHPDVIATSPVEDRHDYLSTACHHGLCVDCRLACKFCGEPCRCNCHRPEFQGVGV